MTVLVIAEKPNQAKKYVEALGEYKSKMGYIEVKSKLFNEPVIVTWCQGHLIQLAEMESYDETLKKWDKNKLPFIPEKFKFNVTQLAYKQFNVIKDLCNKLDCDSTIIIATDPDREGEAIARYVLNKINPSKEINIKRLWANTQEPAGLRESFKNLKDATETYKYYLEAEARSIADWLVGMNFSRLVTIELNNYGVNNGIFSVGRVQTPTLFMVYKRNLEIENFQSQKYYSLNAIDNNSNPKCTFKSKLKFNNQEEFNNYCAEQQIKNVSDGEITNIETTEKIKSAPQLFKLGGIQKVANKKWGYTLDKTLSIVQGLYDKGFLSYPRTDCNLITTNEFNYLKANFEQYKKLINIDIQMVHENPRKTYVNDEKVLEHYAIVPTKTIPTKEELAQFTEEQTNIYKEVVLRSISIFESDYVYKETKVKLMVKNTEFSTNGKVETNKGWKKFVDNKSDKEKVNLPDYKKGQIINVTLDLKEGVTKPPQYLSEATLGGEGGLMEKCSNSIEDDELKENLSNVSGIGTPATRSSIIKGLIDRGFMVNEKNKLYLTNKGKLICHALEDTELTSVEMTAEWEHKLKEISNVGTREEQAKFIESIKKYISDIISPDKEFINKEKIENELKEIEKQEVIGLCPNCQNKVKKFISKKKQAFYTCTNRECNFYIAGTISNKKITEKVVKEIIDKGESSIIKGFKSKNGKNFDAKLKLSKNGVEFKFENKK